MRKNKKGKCGKISTLEEVRARINSNKSKKREWQTKVDELRKAHELRFRSPCPNCGSELKYPFTKCDLCGFKRVPPEEKEEKRSRRISQRVKNEVWRRDKGRCAECGSRVNLEYDHIVPFSKGGSNTVRNIELLCQDCNRKKYNKI